MDKRDNKKEPDGRIIFVNSYKGGAGKTTLSLTHCIDSLFHEKKYENVVYVDLDVQGTATSYLFEEGKLTEGNCFRPGREPVEIELALEGEKASLHMAHLNPEFKNRSTYGEKYFIHHRELDAAIFKGAIKELIKDCFNQEPKTLLVLDCAPGFSELEQDILLECYQMALKGSIEIEEDYVTTLDASHIKKCVNSLKAGREEFCRGQKKRCIHIVLNDIQNYVEYAKKEEGKDSEKIWQEFADSIKADLGDSEVQIYRWKYSQSIAVKNTYTKTVNVENQVDDYIFTSENYKEIG